MVRYSGARPTGDEIGPVVRGVAGTEGVPDWERYIKMFCKQIYFINHCVNGGPFQNFYGRELFPPPLAQTYFGRNLLIQFELTIKGLRIRIDRLLSRVSKPLWLNI